MNACKKYLRFFICLLAYALCTTLVFSQNNTKNNKVAAPQFEKKLYTDTFVLEKMPNTSFSDAILEAIQDIKPNVGGEVLHSFELTPKKELTENERDIKMLEVLFDVETLKDSVYYSNSRKKYREFILESYVVDSIENKNKIAALTVGTPPLKKSSFLAYQEDSSFGKGVREIQVYYNEKTHEVYTHIVNLEQIKYKSFLPIAEPRAMSLIILIQRKGNMYHQYMVVGTHTKTKMQFVRDKASKSLTYRMYAMGRWFEEYLKNRL